MEAPGVNVFVVLLAFVVLAVVVGAVLFLAFKFAGRKVPTQLPTPSPETRKTLTYLVIGAQESCELERRRPRLQILLIEPLKGR